jgi:hypothetical protein
MNVFSPEIGGKRTVPGLPLVILPKWAAAGSTFGTSIRAESAWPEIGIRVPKFVWC